MLRPTCNWRPSISNVGDRGQQAVSERYCCLRMWAVSNDSCELVARARKEVLARARSQPRRHRSKQRIATPGRKHSSTKPLCSLFEENPIPMWVFDRASLRFLAISKRFR